MKITRIHNPLIPRNKLDPANQFGNLRRARSQTNKRFKIIDKEMRKLIKTFDPTIKLRVNRNVYEYQVDAEKFSAINLFIQRLLNEQLLDNPQGVFTNAWWLNANLTDAYVDGASDTIESAQRIADPAEIGVELSAQVQRISIEDEMLTRGFQNRLALVHSRVFNEMDGLSSSMKNDLAQTLARGMASGDGVRKLANDVSERVGVGHSRAMRIVRTEVLNAYRTATAEETDSINEDVYDGSDWVMKSLWWSALAPTSRSWHISRHGQLYTTQEVSEFYSKNGNSINCLCSQSVVLQNRKTKEVLQQDLLDRMQKQKEATQASMPAKKTKKRG